MKPRRAMQAAVNIESVIVTLRGEKVLLDMDLARIYGVPTKVLHQAVKRNLPGSQRIFAFNSPRRKSKRWSQIVTASA